MKRNTASMLVGLALGATLLSPALATSTTGDPQACVELHSLVLRQYDRTYAAEGKLATALWDALRLDTRVRRAPVEAAYVKLLKVNGTWARMDKLARACTGQEG